LKLDKLIWHLETYDDFGTSKYNVFFVKSDQDLVKVVLSGKELMKFLEGICILEMHWQSSKETIERVKNYLLPIC
jgi:hypothetical protein